MPILRISEVAELVDVSPDTVRRWIASGRLAAERDGQGRRWVAGASLAAFMRTAPADDPGRAFSSARNRFRGVVTNVVCDEVMAHVEIQAGPHRVVSLMSREAVDDLGLEVGSLATAIVKSTDVIVETESSAGIRHA
ncbi:TOBE domain-containing protein [Allosalinactinospora lopnorensis]|uniref:TOBE domain-containing protein n=1 Tax=Allosalinactinospora lopnorensis TaxID=1352348 RepID=UPI000623D6D2|nr:TOBE domain-containing protein [Allosalinactinospora lopnorensis]